MGYDVERFVGGTIDNELVCQICKLVLEDPVETPCQHFFCIKCISNWLEVSDRTVDLKQPCRLLRNLLARQELKCDFEKDGCNMVGKLKGLAKHRTTCNKNPDAEIGCNEGCNLKILRRDQARHCHVHFSNKVHSQDVEISKLQLEVARLKLAIIKQRREIDELDALIPHSKVRFLLNSDKEIAWKTFDNMKTHHNLGILENDDKYEEGVAQLAHQLQPSCPSFSVCIVNKGSTIGVGLANRSYSRNQNLDKTIFYMSNGHVVLNGNHTHT